MGLFDNLLSRPLLIRMHLNLLLLRLLDSLSAVVPRSGCTIILLRLEYLHTLTGQSPSVAKLSLRFSRSRGRTRVCTASKMCAGDINIIVVHGSQKLFIVHLQVLMASIAKAFGRGDLVRVIRRCSGVLMLSLPSCGLMRTVKWSGQGTVLLDRNRIKIALGDLARV